MEYDFKGIERKWQEYWKKNATFKAEIDVNRPKYYVLDMFPYPSGAGLHVGHPLGYIASDIYSRYKRLTGFNVLHPMGYDAFGLPAEQYAIQTGQHPADTTEKNIKRYREQLDKIGLSFDWSRQVKTCDPPYYKWTQWAFIRMFEHWYNKKTDKAEPVETLIKEFEKNGNLKIDAASGKPTLFSDKEWKSKSEKEQQEILMHYRLAYLADTVVNWCPALGTVLANDEVAIPEASDETHASEAGMVSKRGGHPVFQKKMKQWCLRITAYAQRLLDGIEPLHWSESLKEMQRNWIGRSEGGEIVFDLENSNEKIVVFTTRPDTIFGSTFMVLAPENELLGSITTPENKESIQQYIEDAKKRTERDRMTNVKSISGVFTGMNAIHPFTCKKIPLWVSDYVLAGYGTGAIMAVPAHDNRDYAFAKHFGLPITEVVSGGDISTGSYDAKEGILINSDFLNGLDVKQAIVKALEEIENKGIGKRMINFRLRDAIFSRQRYWGEPFPIYYKDDLPYPLQDKELPLQLPEVDKFQPTDKGEPPLGRAKNWKTKEGYPLELNTMPGFAGSSAYYLRYMDPHNDMQLVSKEANDYWRDIDLYIGGTEHATGHLLYSRFWNMFLYDMGLVCEKEPFKKMVNQGMIQGRSNFIYKIKNSSCYVSYNLRKKYDIIPIHIDVNLVENDILDTEAFRISNREYENAEFVFEEDGKYHCGWAVEKMSKSLLNVVNPDNVIERYGADTLRMYEMFLGPIEMSKPWDTNGIEGVHRFLKKFWRLFFNPEGQFVLSEEEPSKEEMKILHKTIKKIKEDIEAFSFNTSVSAFMICTNELTELRCNKRKILENLVIILSPFAPHICEELWREAGHNSSISKATFPAYEEQYLKENSFQYPVSFNGKMRYRIELPLDMQVKDIEQSVMNHEETNRWIQNNPVKKIVVVPGKIINVVF